MRTPDLTFTSPEAAAASPDDYLLALTIGWHPDTSRIGQQYLWADSEPTLELSRYAPLFQAPTTTALSLGYGGISRQPLRFTRHDDGSVSLSVPPGRMAVELNGEDIRGAAHLLPSHIESCAVLVLGRAVLLCLHRTRCLPRHNPVDGWLGVSAAAIRTRDLIQQAAKTDSTVLLLGETGTGKEVAARAIHHLGPRGQARMVAVNMAALSESLAAADLFGAVRGAYTGAQTARIGLFAEAQEATLFLDEIGNTPVAVQPMLLRVLETGDFRPLGALRDQHSTARLIAATDQNLHAPGFNQALLRRLESFTIHLPSLRSRREDIGVLIAHLAQAIPGTEAILPLALVVQFVRYDWPGNVRQLSQVLQRCILALRAGERPDFAALAGPQEVGPSAVPAVSLAAAAIPAKTRTNLLDVSADAVLQSLDSNRWYIDGAARSLGISRPSMYKLLKSHPLIRPAAQIDMPEIRVAFDACAGDVENCAARLKTPTEALRRHLSHLGMLP